MLPVRRLVAVVLLLGLAGGALAGDKDEDRKKTVDLQVWTIRATTKNSDVSPELRSIADKLKKQFKYTGFKLEKKATGKTQIGKTFSTTLIDGYSAKVTPKRRDGAKVQLQVEFHKGGARKFAATVTLTAGQSQLFGGWKLNSTDALIVAVSGR